MVLNKKKLKKIKEKLDFIYSKDSENIFSSLLSLFDKYSMNKIIVDKIKKYKGKYDVQKFSEKDSILITYADSILKKSEGRIIEKPLVTLNKFLLKYVKDSISGVHILPFCPYSSDDGFSIIDYKKVNPSFGNWVDIRRISKNYRLMADLVINHISSKSEWFKGFLSGNEKYKDYFISYDKKVDTSKVFRPRMHPLLTKFKVNCEGKKKNNYVWTTFSEDQIDLNFKNPEVFIEMMDVLLFYFSQGIEIIRLDAVGFLWKELGTSCFHLKKTHEMVKLIRLVSEVIAPYSVIITETNVPYKDNVSYFGDSVKGKSDEAHMVYQFSYPPLVLDAFNRHDSKYLVDVFNKNKKVSSLSNDRLFFNFLASHDGIGVLAGKEVLSKKDFDLLINNVKSNNGLISYKSLGDGSKIPYELNINYYDALNNPNSKTKGLDDLSLQKFLASQSLIIFSKGVPGIYIHSLLGSRNYNYGVKRSGINRRINREKLNYDKIVSEIDNVGSLRNSVFTKYLDIINFRRMYKEFSPYVSEDIINVKNLKNILMFERKISNSRKIIVINLSPKKSVIKGLFGKDTKGNEKVLEVDPYDIIILR